MGTLRPSSVAVHEGEDSKIPSEVHDHQKDLDAGALFVLKSRGDESDGVLLSFKCKQTATDSS